MKIFRTFVFALTVLLVVNVSAQSVSTIDANIRTQIIEAVIKRFNQSYVFPEVAKEMEKSIRERLKKGEYDKITDASEFAKTLKANLREVSQDTHIEVVFSPRPLPPMSEVEQAETQAEREKRQRDYGRINNGFLKVERLQGNIGFLDIDLFVDPIFAGETATAAMNFLSNTDALIIDLRYCPGGNGGMVAFLSTYFFSEQIHLSDYFQREENITKQSWTLPFVSGKRYLNKDIFILTSSKTHSAAEAFAYNLQSLNRAVIIGETTKGGAHTIKRYRLNENFAVQVPVGRSINAVTKTNWEGKGVTPKLQVTADKAFKLAHLTALKSLLQKNPNQENADEIKQIIEKFEKELTEKTN